MHRREFLTASAAGVAAAALPSPAAAKDAAPMLPVIDTHQHLWDLRELKLSWAKPGDPLNTNFTPTEYAQAIEGLNVVKSVYMEVDVAPDQQQKEVDYVVGLCEGGKTTTCAAVVSGRPASDLFDKYITPYKGHKYVKGVRQVLHVETTPSGYCLDPKFVKGVRLLGDLGLSFDLCVRAEDLPNAAKLIDQCPGTRFILDHCGNPSVKYAARQLDVWRKDMAEVARRPNVVCKVSGVIVTADKNKWTAAELAPAVNGTIAAFGWDRVMFGGDWPVCTLVASFRGWLTALREIVADQPEANRRKLFHDNAAKVYGL